MDLQRWYAARLAEVLSADERLGYELLSEAEVIVSHYDDYRDMIRPLLFGVSAADQDVARLRAVVQEISRRHWRAINVRAFIDSFRPVSEAADDAGDAALARSIREFAKSMTGRVILELPARTRTDGGPVFDAVEIAPLTPPDCNGNIEPVEDLDELAPELRATARWCLYGHTPGEGVDTIGDFNSAYDALNIAFRLFGDLRHKRWAADLDG